MVGCSGLARPGEDGAVTIARLRIDSLRLNFQGPECLFEEVVREKMMQLAAGESFPPIVVRYDGESYFLQDGFHRVEASRRTGAEEIDAEVLAGTLEEMEKEFRAIQREALDRLAAEIAADGA
jgi:uncharacterized ParB-like nuclease family protein